jgi:hypothetical protein
MRDRSTGLLLALLGIGILVAYRMGAFNSLTGKTGDAAPLGSSVESAMTGLFGIADRLRAVPTATSTVAPAGNTRGSVGTAEDAVGSSYAPLTDPWAPGGYLDESTRARARARVVVQNAAPVTGILADRISDIRATWIAAENGLGLDPSFWLRAPNPGAAGPEGAVAGSNNADLSAV